MTQLERMRSPTLSMLQRRTAAQAVVSQHKTMVLPCGCVVPNRMGYVLGWLLKHNYIGLFDLVHTEDFVRHHLKRGQKCA